MRLVNPGRRNLSVRVSTVTRVPEKDVKDITILVYVYVDQYVTWVRDEGRRVLHTDAP